MILKLKWVQKLLGWCLFMKLFFTAVALSENSSTASYGASGVFCFNGASYIPVDTSWNTSCVTYRCTRNGIQADNMTYSRCDFLTAKADILRGCRRTIVESEDTCCQGTACQVFSENLPDDVSSCPSGWTEIRQPRRASPQKRQVGPRFKSNDNVQCLKYSKSRKAFYDAEQDCRKEAATLINLESWLSDVSWDYSLLATIKEVDNGFWTGLSSDGMKFYWDDLLVKKAYSYRDACGPFMQQQYGWDCRQPDGNATCAKATYANDLIRLASTPCDQQLHYACIRSTRNGRSYVSRSNEACPEDWLFSPSSKKCYKLFNDRQSAFRAMSSCQDVSATLASASNRDELLAIQSCFSDTTDSVPKEIHGSICLSNVPGNCVQPNLSLPIWFMNSTTDRWNCTTIKNLKLSWLPSELNKNNISLSSCYRKLPYICEKPVSDQLAVVTASLEIASQSSEGIELTCKVQRDLAEDGDCGWRVDGVYDDQPSCTFRSSHYEQRAYECFTTDLTSGKRVFSSFIITEKEHTAQESLRLTAIIKMPSDWLNSCRNPIESPNIRRLLQQLLFSNDVSPSSSPSSSLSTSTSIPDILSMPPLISLSTSTSIPGVVVTQPSIFLSTSTSSISDVVLNSSSSSISLSTSTSIPDVALTAEERVKKWSSKITLLRNVACWASQSTATLTYELKLPSPDHVRSKRSSENWSNSLGVTNLNQSPSAEQSDEIEQDLTDYWIREKGGAVLSDTGVNLTVEYISVKNLYFCKRHRLETNELGVLTVPRTAIGEWFNVSMCLSTARPIVSMYCRPQFATGAFWETFVRNECPETLSVSEKQLILLSMNLAISPSISWHLSEALKVLKTANNGLGMTTTMIVDTANFLEKTLSIFTDSRLPTSTSEEVAKSIPAIVDQVMRAPKESVWQAEAVASSSTTLMKALDVASEKLLETCPIGETTRVIYNNVALEVSRDPNLEGVGVRSSEAFSPSSLAHLRSDRDLTEAGFVAQIAAWLHEGEKTSKRFTLYRNAKLFKGRLRAPATDIILSATIEGMEENAATPDFIRAKFANMKGVHSGSVECGFWSNVDHDWSTEGCRKVYTDDVSTLCYCNHTTSFAILMGAKPQDPAHYQALSWITLVGLSISIAALLLVLITFLMFKAMRQSLSQKVLFNLSLAIFLLDVTFVAGSQSTKNKWACMVIAVLLHYLLLTCFAWMAIEAIHQYFRFVKVIGTYIPRFIVKAAIPAWGLPAVVISIILAKDYQLYIRFDNVCWVQETVLYYGVFLPIALVLVFNFTVFGLILRSLLSQKNSLLRSNQTEMQLMKLHLRAAVALLVLMGLTWIFGFLSFQEAGVLGLVCQYLFCIFNSIQGLLVFVFHCMREKNVINLWKKLFRCGQTVPKHDEFSTVSTHDNENTTLKITKKAPADTRL